MKLIYKVDDKRRLYELIDLYIEGKISADEFSDEFYICYDLELDYDTLSPKEDKLFEALSLIAGRMTDKETYEQYPYFLTSEEQVRKKAEEVKEALYNERYKI